MSQIGFWNEQALEVHRRDFTVGSRGDSFAAGMLTPQQPGPTATSRALAMVHVGMFNAVALTVGGAQPYTGGPGAVFVLPPALTPPSGAPGSYLQTACDVAVATVAASLLIRLFSTQSDYINQKLATSLAAFGTPDAAFLAGRKLGWDLSDAIWEHRSHDRSGSNRYGATAPHFTEQHLPDPFARDQELLGPAWGHVVRFCPPKNPLPLSHYIADYPAPGTAAYNHALREVKDFGAAVSPSRTAAQTQTGIYWGYDGARGLGTPPRLYNQAVLAAVSALGLTLLEEARLLALVNCAMADAAVVAWDAKYTYNLWRPVIGVPRTAGQSPGAETWPPLGMPRTNENRFNLTPPFPAYPSGHATFGAVAFAMLAYFLAERAGRPIASEADLQSELQSVSFTLTSDEYDGVNRDPDGTVRPALPRTYTLAEAIVDNAISRVFLGVHWRYDGLADTAKNLSTMTLNVAAELKAKIGGVAVGLKLAGEIHGGYFR